MFVITGKSHDEVYRKMIIEILKNGAEVSPRGTKTYELAPATLVIEDARKFLTMPSLRKGNYTFQLAEAFWMIRGSNSLEEIAHYNKIWNYFADEDAPEILNGAYGERLRAWIGEDKDIDQFREVFDKLKKDPYSRQAVMIIFDPERDNEIHSNGNYSKDIPCTNYFNFQIRDGKLNMYTVMRSNDLHKGTLYDIPNFIIFQHILAGWLDVEVGKYTHTAASFHVYESDVENFIDIYNTKDEEVYKENVDYGDPRLSLSDFNVVMATLEDIELFTRTNTRESILENEQDLINFIISIENKWWRSVAAQIAGYNLRKAGGTKEEFERITKFVTNEYAPHVQSWKEIKK